MFIGFNVANLTHDPAPFPRSDPVASIASVPQAVFPAHAVFPVSSSDDPTGD